MPKHIPAKVLAAKLRGDRKALSSMGRIGRTKSAIARRKNLDLEEVHMDYHVTQAEKDEYARMRSANEHIIPLSTYD